MENGKNTSSFEPFFPEEKKIELGESYIANRTFEAYLLGKAIARIHANGLIDYDNHLENWIITRWGKPLRLDVDDFQYREQISPEMAAEDLVATFLTSNEDAFHAILSGYVSHSIPIIDSQQLGFTKTLLSLIGGTVIATPKIRRLVFDKQYLRTTIGLIPVVTDKEFLRFRIREGINLEKIWERDFVNVFCIAIYMILSGADASILLEGIDNKSLLPPDQTALLDFLERFIRKDGKIESIESYIKEDTNHNELVLGVALLITLYKDYDYPNPSPDLNFGMPASLQPDELAKAVLWKVVKNVPPEIYRRFIDGLIDFTNFVVYELLEGDQEVNNVKKTSVAIRFAQGVFPFLKYSQNRIDDDEQQLLRIIRDQHILEEKWLKIIDIPPLVMSCILLLNSQSNALTGMFVKSAEHGKVKLSLITESIEKRKTSICLLYKQIWEMDNQDSHIQSYDQLALLLVSGLRQALTLHGEAIAEHDEEFNPTFWMDDDSPIMAELKWAKEVMEFCQSKSIVSEEGRNHLERFIRAQGFNGVRMTLNG